MNYCNLTPKQLAFISNIIAIELSNGKSSDELNVLGNFIVSVGSSILTIAAQKQSLEALNGKSKD